MAKRKGFPPVICLVLMLFLQSNSCTSCSGIPSDFNSVVLQATSLKITAGETVTITATVPKDTTGAGVSWSSDAPPSPGTFTVESVTVATYKAPNSVAAQFTVTVTATSIAFPTETKPITITVEPPPPLKITTTSLPNGTIGVAYPSTTLQATGGVPPYTWQLVTAANTFPAGLTVNPDGSITGTPLVPGGVFNTFTVKVSDSEATPMTQTTTAGQLSITITNLLSGNYAFEFSGFNSSGAVVVAGSFTSDGVSKISGGVEDFNSIVTGTNKNQTFTGTYTLTGNRGQLIFSSLAGSPTYDFAIDSTGAHGRLVEFDSTGIRGSGELEQQNTSTCGSNTLSGSGATGLNYVIGVSGAAGNVTGITPGPFAMVGRFTAEVPTGGAPGNIDTGEVDINAPNELFTASSTFSGTFQASNQAARCTMTLTQSLSNMTFSVYPVSSVSGALTEAFVVETDSVGVGTPYVTVGKMIQQVGYPFTTPSNTMANNNVPSVAGLSGNAMPNGQPSYLPFAGVTQLVPNGGAGFTISLVENIGGGVSSFLGGSALTVTAQLNDTFGRFDTNLVSPISPVFYVIGPNEAFIILQNINAAVIGVFEPQSAGPFSTTFVAPTFAEGTAAPDTSATTDFSGVATITSTGATTGTIAGTQDTSTAAANTSGQAVTGTFDLSATGQADGSGTLTLTAPAAFTGQFIIVSPTKIALISTTAGDPNPVLIFLGNCESTCGED